jgi:hypothetical protein
MHPQSDASLNTPYNRMAFREAATHFGAGYHRPTHHMVREAIYTVAALAPFAVGFATKDPDKRFMTLRSVAVAEAVALLAYEIATHHEKQKKGQGQKPACTPKSKPQYQAMVDATEKNNGRGMQR